MLPLKLKHFLWIFTLSLAMLTPVFAGESWAGGDPSVQFTEQEMDWLAAHPVIVAAPDPDFPPVEFFDENGQYRGIAADFIALIKKKLGIRLKIVHLKNWDEVLEKARTRQIDLVTAATRTPQRQKYLQFTSSFIELPAVIIVRQKVTKKLTMENLKGMKVAVVYRYAAHDYISNLYPDLDLDLVPDVQTGLRKVSFGMVDAMVANIATASYNIEREKITNLRLGGESGFIYRLAFAPCKGNWELNSILEKGLAQITPLEKQIIYGKWITLHRDSILKSKKFWISISMSMGTFALLVGSILLWNRTLRRRVEQKTKELKHEIVEHEKAKQVISESETMYRGIFESTKNGVAVFTAVNGGTDFTFVDFNKAGEKIDKIKREELIGKSVLEVFPAMKTFGLFKVFQRVWATAQPEHYPAALYKDHRIAVWRESFVYKLPTGEIVAVYSDETERKQAEDALRESEEKLAGIINSITEPMVMLDEQINIGWANKVAQRLFGPELIGKKCYSILAGREKICKSCIAEKCFKDGKDHEHEIQIRGNNNNRIDLWGITSAAALHADGRAKTVVAIYRDITEKKALQAETMRAGHLASIGELAAGVAHEINNPTNSIINLSQVLINECNPKNLEHDVAGRIIKEGNRIAGIVGSLLAFARDRKGQRDSVKASEIMTETLALTEAQVRKDGIDLKIDIPRSLPGIIGHMQQIQQVFLNIINNSRFALNQKYPDFHENKILEIKSETVTVDDRLHVRVTFLDRGIGIPADIIENVMDPFFTTKSSDIGTGLGLSISHGIISDHGGKLRIESLEQEFTKVIVDLPAGE